MQTYRAALNEYNRKPVEFPITVECYVGAQHATAHEECRGPLEYKYNAYASWGLQNRSTQGSFEDFARDRFIIGDRVSVEEEIARAIEPGGEVRDEASPKLHQVRRDLRIARDRMMSQLQSMLHSLRNSLQDAVITQRNGRYVLPVRADEELA